MQAAILHCWVSTCAQTDQGTYRLLYGLCRSKLSTVLTRLHWGRTLVMTAFFRIRTYSHQILHSLSDSLSYAPCTLGVVELRSAAKLHFASP